MAREAEFMTHYFINENGEVWREAHVKQTSTGSFMQLQELKVRVRNGKFQLTKDGIKRTFSVNQLMKQYFPDKYVEPSNGAPTKPVWWNGDKYDSAKDLADRLHMNPQTIRNAISKHTPVRGAFVTKNPVIVGERETVIQDGIIEFVRKVM